MDLGGEQPSMLPDYVEQMERVQQVIAALVRFQRFDDGAFGCGECLYEFVPLVPPGCEDSALPTIGK